MRYYSIQHLTRFDYAHPVCESAMEVRMQPRGDGNQRCLTFSLSVSPRCRVFSYRDHLANQVHHFDIPGDHRQLVIVAHSLVEQQPLGPIPNRLTPAAWQELDVLLAQGDFWEMLLPSTFAEPTEALRTLAAEWKITRRDDPLSMLHEISRNVFNNFEYLPRSTKVDSPIDVALGARRGVCQDFAHIMIALVRGLKVPCRYVSGYLFHANGEQSTTEGASHAWVEAFLPGLGWTGFDPTNDMLCSDRHIRVAVGRDYADVPPARGVYKGGGESQLSVSVSVNLSDAPNPVDLTPPVVKRRLPSPLVDNYLAQQQQEQQ
jgi:transglutaminase-like putative cysteine protease